MVVGKNFPWYWTAKGLGKFPVFETTSTTLLSGVRKATLASCSISLEATRTEPGGTNCEKCSTT